MPSDHVGVTAELLTNDTSVAYPRLRLNLGSTGSSRLLDWVVGLTEWAQRHLAAAAQAEVGASGLPLEAQSRFANDAAGGGFRSLEAARALRAPAAS